MVSFRGRLSPRKLPSPNFYIYTTPAVIILGDAETPQPSCLRLASLPPPGGGRELHHLGYKPSQQSAE